MAEPATPPGDPALPPAPPADLGDSGKKALDEERAARRASDKTAKDLQTRLDDVQAKLKARDDADLSESDRLRGQLSTLEAEKANLTKERQAERVRFTIEREAARLRFADPGDATNLIDQARIVFDTAGNPTNLPALLEELAKAKPYLTARPGNGSFEGGPRGGAAGGEFSMDDWLRNKARH